MGEDLIPDDFNPTRVLRCYCGETTLSTSQVGNPPDCAGCDECHSTLAESKALCKQRSLHEWVQQGREKNCMKCNARELEDRPVREFTMIFLNHKNEWINNQGEVIADKLVEKYDILGRYRRDGTFESRDDMRSMLVNKPLEIQQDYTEIDN